MSAMGGPPRDRQLPLALSFPPDLGRASFLVGRANQAALAVIDRWPDWPAGPAIVHGAAGSGKTHLLAVWAERARPIGLDRDGLLHLHEIGPPADPAQAWAIDDADRQVAGEEGAERALFHLLNHAGAAGQSVLLTGREAPGRWPVALADLASRLKAGLAVALDPPDDALLAGVLAKLFADRRHAVDERLIGYAVKRMERSLAAARELVERVDRASLAGRQPVGRGLVGDALDAMAASRD